MENIFGYLGGVIGITALLPQLIQSWKTKKTRDLAIKTYLLLGFNNILWASHGLLQDDYVLFVANVAALALVSGIVAAKLRFG